MRIKLGVIASEGCNDYYKIIEKEFKQTCDIKFFIIKSLEEADKYYMENKDFVDGFIFSGVFVKEAISPGHFDPDIPFRFLIDDESILYKELFGLLLTRPELDISRVYIDFAYVLDSFKAFKDYLNDQGKPVEGDNLFEKNDILLSNHLSLWQENKIDLSITAMGHFIPELEKNGVSYIYIRPTLAQAREVFIRIIDELTIIKLENNWPVVANISVEGTDSGPADTSFSEKLALIKKETGAFLKKSYLVDTTQTAESSVQFYCTYEDFSKITSGAKSCSLLGFLELIDSFQIKIGWGAGREFYQAKGNAEKALMQAKAYPGSCSFFVNEEQKVIGPLKNEDRMQFSEQVESGIILLSQKIGINNINLQKIISYCGKTGTNKLSSEDVASCLSVTVRAANRILNKIESKKYAAAIFEKRQNNKGRPKKYYELSFLDKNGNLLWMLS